MVAVYIIIFIIALSILIIVHELGHFAMAKAFHVYCFDFSVGFGPAIVHRKRKGGETYFSFRCVPLGGYVSMYGEDEDEDKKHVKGDEENIEEAPKESEEDTTQKISTAQLLNSLSTYDIPETSLETPQETPSEETTPVESEQEVVDSTPSQEEKPPHKETWRERRKRIKLEEENLVIDPSRSIMAQNRGKQATVYVAGIVMNCLLALVLFFVYDVFFPQKALSPDIIRVEENSIAESIGLSDDDVIYYPEAISMRVDHDNCTFYVFDEDVQVNYEGDIEQTETVYAGILLPSSIAVDALDYDDYFNAFYVSCDYDEDGNPLVDEEGYITYTLENILDRVDTQLPISLDIDLYSYPYADYETADEITLTNRSFTLNLEYNEKKDTYSYESLGLKMSVVEYSQSFGQAITKTFTDFGESCTTVVKALGRLFTGSGWNQLGGVIAIYGQTTTVLTEYGFGFFLYTWGLISVNLALLNIIPIPGLDGWQLLVCGIEAATRRKVPKKFKTVMSIIGYVIIIGLFVAILCKDLIALIV
ncbi:MAG: site-2 protease family protein [Coprobacillus sp.]|nr:site-2 protease family protein [Coprobacillus sp.]